MFEHERRCASLCDIGFPQIESRWIREFSDIAAHAWKDRGVGRFGGVWEKKAASDITTQQTASAGADDHEMRRYHDRLRNMFN